MTGMEEGCVKALARPTSTRTSLTSTRTETSVRVDAEDSTSTAPSSGHPISTERKRKASTESDAGAASPKRPKPEDEPRPTSDDTARNEQPSRDEIARLKLEERKRGKRLFGGLLNTLSQANTNGPNKRRREIEQRQHERVQRQRHEDDQKRAEQLARVKRVRMAEQISFEEDVVSFKGPTRRTQANLTLRAR
jgi:hypothetical protein